MRNQPKTKRILWAINKPLFFINIMENGLGRQTWFMHKLTLKASLSTVYNVKKTINIGNGIQRKPISGGVNKTRNHDFIKALKTKIAKDPTTFIRKIAAELNVDPKTVRTAVHDELGFKSYTRMPRHLFTEWMKARNLESCKKVLRYIKNHGSTVKIFSDENFFTGTLFWTAETTGTSQSQYLMSMTPSVPNM